MCFMYICPVFLIRMCYDARITTYGCGCHYRYI